MAKARSLVGLDVHATKIVAAVLARNGKLRYKWVALIPLAVVMTTTTNAALPIP